MWKVDVAQCRSKCVVEGDGVVDFVDIGCLDFGKFGPYIVIIVELDSLLIIVVKKCQVIEFESRCVR